MKSELGGEGFLSSDELHSVVYVVMLTLRALMVAMGENRSKTDIELALIRKAESENTINSDTNKQGNAWART